MMRTAKRERRPDGAPQPRPRSTVGYTQTMGTSGALAHLAVRHHLLAVYLFGSRADDGLRRLDGAEVDAGGSDLDVGVYLEPRHAGPDQIAALQVELEDAFEPLHVDLVPLDRVDPLLQWAAIRGHRVAATDTTAADEKELEVMRRAAELLPIQRALELATFGVATT
jgi:predicted nucleotidyltransferase